MHKLDELDSHHTNLRLKFSEHFPVLLTTALKRFDFEEVRVSCFCFTVVEHLRELWHVSVLVC